MAMIQFFVDNQKRMPNEKGMSEIKLWYFKFYIFLIPEILNKDCQLHLYHCITGNTILLNEHISIRVKKQTRRAESKRDIKFEQQVNHF